MFALMLSRDAILKVLLGLCMPYLLKASTVIRMVSYRLEIMQITASEQCWDTHTCAADANCACGHSVSWLLSPGRGLELLPHLNPSSKACSLAAAWVKGSLSYLVWPPRVSDSWPLHMWAIWLRVMKFKGTIVEEEQMGCLSPLEAQSMTILAAFSERHQCQWECRAWLGQVKWQPLDTGAGRGQSAANISPVFLLSCCSEAIIFFSVDQYTVLLPQVHLQGAEEQTTKWLSFLCAKQFLGHLCKESSDYVLWLNTANIPHILFKIPITPLVPVHPKGRLSPNPVVYTQKQIQEAGTKVVMAKVGSGATS